MLWATYDPRNSEVRKEKTMRIRYSLVACLVLMLGGIPLVGFLSAAGPVESAGSCAEMLTAIQEGGYELVEGLVGKCPDVNGRDSNGRSALHWASWKDHAQIVRLLLEKGANPNARDGDGKTPLMGANREVAKLLLEKGAEVEARDVEYNTALLWALNYYEDVAHVYKERIFARRKPAERTPLNPEEKLEVVKIILDNGADINAKSARGATALSNARRPVDTTIAQFLLEKGADVNSAVSSAGPDIYLHSGEFARLLLKHGADTGIKDKSGRTALMLACYQSKSEIAEMFLESGADTNVVDNDGNSPLVWAINGMNHQLVELLLRHGGDKNYRDDNGSTILMTACKAIPHGPWGGLGRDRSETFPQDKLKTIQLLLETGTDVNARNDIGMTALMGASYVGDVGAAKLLLEKGADAQIKNADGHTALDLASRTKHTELVSLLKAHTASGDSGEKSSEDQPRQTLKDTMLVAFQAALEGISEYQAQVGGFYEHGKESIPQDLKKAVKWYRRAAEKGNANGAKALARMYEQGIGMPMDQEAALKWYTQAAKGGDVESQVKVGTMHEEGIGTEKNCAEALRWYIEAYGRGSQEGERKMEAIRSTYK
jgi:ankyrin repeat protein